MIESSELIINPDGSVFHLHLRPGQIAGTVLLVGDPGRVDTIAGYFDGEECRVSNREFSTVTGRIGQKRLTVLSTGIGTDNIDIVVNELDALVNIDFTTREIKTGKTSLNLIRLGTSGAVQPDLELGAVVLAEVSCGFDGLLNYYAGRDSFCDLTMEEEFMSHMGWNDKLPSPYFIRSSEKLARKFAAFTTKGITVSAPGFYGPQGRVLRLPLADPAWVSKIEAFRHNGHRITNFEMESSALAGLGAMLGHEATTLCTIIAQRIAGDSRPDYQKFMRSLIENTLSAICRDSSE